MRGAHGGLKANDWVLNISTLLYVFSLLGVVPYLSRYAVSLGAGGFEVSLLGPSYAVTAIGLRLLVGRLIDMGYASTLMFLGGVLNALALAVLAVTSSVPMILASRLIQGVSVAMFIPASLYSASVGDPQGAQKRILWRSTMWGLGAAVGPAVAGFILSVHSWALMFAVAALIALASGFLGLSFRSPRFEGGGGGGGIATLPFALASLTLFMYVVGYQSLNIFLPSLHEVEGLPKYYTAYFFTSLALFNLGSRLALSLTGGFSPGRMALTGLALSLAGFAATALDPLSLRSLAYAALVGAGLGLLFPSLQVISLLGVPEGRRGSASSIYTAMFDFGSLIGPPLVITLSGEYKSALVTSTLFVALAFTPITLTISRKHLNPKT
ncbi:MAG: MFS transporter [Thermoprotei archaeon]|nr:MFS transporter [Thermoprotei archaeon]